MSDDTINETDTETETVAEPARERVLTVLSVVVAMLLVAGVGLAVVGMTAGSAAAATAANNSTATATPGVEEKAPMFPNSSSNVDNESWMAGQQDPSIANVSEFALRVGPFVIGSGPAAGGTGPAGILVFGLVILGAVAGMAVQPRVGIAGGTTIAVVAVFGLATTATLPFWMYAVLLFAMGVAATTVVLAALR